MCAGAVRRVRATRRLDVLVDPWFIVSAALEADATVLESVGHVHPLMLRCVGVFLAWGAVLGQRICTLELIRLHKSAAGSVGIYMLADLHRINVLFFEMAPPMPLAATVETSGSAPHAN